MYQFIQSRVIKYMELRRKEISIVSISSYLGESFKVMLRDYPKAVKWSFKYRNYGQAKSKNSSDPNKKTFERDYPLEFKLFFFSMLKSSRITPNGTLETIKGLPSNVWKPC